MENGESFEVQKKQKKQRGRPSIPIELKKQNRTNWMLNSEWYCDICNNGINYRYTGKCNHLKTQMHKRYVERNKLLKLQQLQQLQHQLQQLQI